MKLVLVAIVLCAAVCVASSMKLLAKSSRHLKHRESNLLKRLVKRQALNDPNCDRRSCATPNCGKDFVAALLTGECCERCVPWEYARSLGLNVQAPQTIQDNRPQQPQYDPYNQYPYNQQPQYQQSRVDVYIYGPDEGARVSSGQSIYFDCEVNAGYNQNAQPLWSRSGNQPLPYKAQSTPLPGNRKLARLTIPDATQSDAGQYVCSAGTGNSADQTSIDLQVTDGGYYPRAQPRAQPQPQPQPQPQQPSYDPYNQYPYNQPGYYPPAQPGYYPPEPQPQPQPQPQPDAYYPPEPQPQPQPQPQPGGDDEGDQDQDDQGGDATPAPQQETTPAPAAQEGGGGDEGEYPEDYSENEK